jgi:hypothetical protein
MVIILDKGPISMNQMVGLNWEHPQTFKISD